MENKQAINIIELDNGVPTNVQTFLINDLEESLKEAKGAFVLAAQKIGMLPDELTEAFDRGIYQNRKGQEVLLVTSNTIKDSTLINEVKVELCITFDKPLTLGDANEVTEDIHNLISGNMYNRHICEASHAKYLITTGYDDKEIREEF